jgi:hypothetical protein
MTLMAVVLTVLAYLTFPEAGPVLGFAIWVVVFRFIYSRLRSRI